LSFLGASSRLMRLRDRGLYGDGSRQIIRTAPVVELAMMRAGRGDADLRMPSRILASIHLDHRPPASRERTAVVETSPGRRRTIRAIHTDACVDQAFRV